MPEKNRIAFVANTSWSIYKFRLYLIKKCIERGYSIFVMAPRDEYTDHFESIKGLTFIELTKFKGNSISPLSDIALYRELVHHYRQIRPGLIFHYTIKANIFGSLAAARLKFPSVSVVTGLGYVFSGNPLLAAAGKILYRRALKTSAEVWFLNPDDQAIFIKEKLIRENSSYVLPGEGVDTEAFYPTPYKGGAHESEGRASTPSAKPIVFLLIGRLIKHKGIFEYVRAADLLRARGLVIECRLLGFFDEANPVAIPKQQLTEWVNRGSINYLGSTDQVSRFIADADCIVLPSYREGMPLSLLEGASMCKALIASDTAGCREIVRDGLNGYLCKVKDSMDLAEKMEKYTRLAPAEKRQMGMEGRQRVEAHYTRDIVTEIYLKKIEGFLETAAMK